MKLAYIILTIIAANFLQYLYIWQIINDGQGHILLISSTEPSFLLTIIASLLSILSLKILIKAISDFKKNKNLNNLKKPLSYVLVSFLFFGVPGWSHLKETFFFISFLTRPKLYPCNYQNSDPKLKPVLVNCLD